MLYTSKKDPCFFLIWAVLLAFLNTSHSFNRDVLLDLYNALDSAIWENWNTSEPICSWEGVSCSLDKSNFMRVTGLQLHQVTGRLPNSIAELHYMQLFISYFGSLENLEVISSFAQLSELVLYDVTCNSTFLETITNSSKMEICSITHCSLSGEIPPSIGNLSNLTELYLSSNSLSGSVPESFGKLKKLTSLYLNDNQLNGTIPDALQDLPLKECDLSNNPFPCPIPEWSIQKCNAACVNSV